MRSFYYLATVLCLICGIRSAEINYNNETYSCSEVICDLSCIPYPNLCNHIAIIGTINETAKTFTPFKTAVILKNEYMLTTVSSGFATNFDADVNMIYFSAKSNGQVSDGFVFTDRQNDKVQLIPGDFDLHGWNDIMLIKLKNRHEHGVDVVKDAEKLRNAMKKGDNIIRYGFVVKGGKIVLKKNIATESPAKCSQSFAYDETIFFDEDLMYCQSDEDAKQPPTAEQSKWLSGLPVFDTFGDREALVGLRSIQSNDHHHQHVFLVTKLKYHCAWIAYHDALPCVGKFFYYKFK
uniref:DOMON domain-containing protein n=1 Tax=Panagrellus redivivus TaxID=6233 RepID=A0A7E4VML8_PANRE